MELAVKEFQAQRAKKIIVSHGFPLHRVDWHPKFPWGLGAWLRWQPYVWNLPFHLRKFDAAVFLSHKANFGRFFDHLVAKATGFETIAVIPNCVQVQPPNESAPGFRESHQIGNGFLAVYVANFCEHKNQLSAIRAFRKAALPESTLVLIGSERNAYSEMLRRLDEELSKESPQSRVLILEGLAREQTEAALRAMDAFVFSAKMETQPLVLIEAMACGKPFAAINSGCISEFKGGLVVNSEQELTVAIRQIATDPALRRKLGEAGLADYKAHYQPSSFIEAYETLMRQLAH
jgi:glycosyltransferase involved in cell wall biosynthesis